MFQSLLWWIGRVNTRSAVSASRSRASFNPCCGGLVASTHGRRGQRAVAMGCFNPCCGGLVASTSSCEVDDGDEVSCFNPCCGGLVASTRSPPAILACGCWFSILVVVDWSRQHRDRRLVPGRELVSILVVVDWSRQPLADPVERPGLTAMFQSLLWWIGRVNISSIETSYGALGFQSLLWWIGRVNTAAPSRGVSQTVSILVVVDWSRQQHSSVVARTAGDRFNPCCGGLVASTTPAKYRSMQDGLLFQSLLWWIGRVNESALSHGHRRRHMFQSLLWWIGRVNRSEPISYTTILSCNASTRARNSGRCDGNGLSVHMHG